MQPSPGQRQALRSILDRSGAKLHLGTLASLKANGWIQLERNADPMGNATSYKLTAQGRRALGFRDPSGADRFARTIGLEAETCEECGGSGHMLILDESDRQDSCPWCRGTGRVGSAV